MSAGIMCLRCRRYIGEGEQACRCTAPIPSEDGVHPVETKPSRWAQAAENALARAIERHG